MVFFLIYSVVQTPSLRQQHWAAIGHSENGQPLGSLTGILYMRGMGCSGLGKKYFIPEHHVHWSLVRKLLPKIALSVRPDSKPIKIPQTKCGSTTTSAFHQIYVQGVQKILPEIYKEIQAFFWTLCLMADIMLYEPQLCPTNVYSCTVSSKHTNSLSSNQHT